MAEKYSDAERAKMPESDFCGSARSYPVVDVEDAHNALQALGRAPAPDRAAIKACVLGKAKAAGWKVEDLADGGADDAAEHGKTAPAALEYKILPALPPTSVQDRRVTGLFSVFGNLDLTDDIGHPGSFTKTFAERGPAKTLFLWQHDLSAPPIAVIESLREIGRDELPAAVKSAWPEATGGAEVVRTYLDTPRGNEVLAAIAAGAPLQQSYGYQAVKMDFATVGEKRVRHLREQRLAEVSDVNFGANDATRAAKAWWDLDTLLAQLQAHLAAWAPPATKTGRRHSHADTAMLNHIHHLVYALGATNCAGETETAAEEAAEPPDAPAAAKSRAATEALTLLHSRTHDLFDLNLAALL